MLLKSISGTPPAGVWGIKGLDLFQLLPLLTAAGCVAGLYMHASNALRANSRMPLSPDCS